MARSEENQVTIHRALQWIIAAFTVIGSVMLTIITFAAMRFFDKFDATVNKVDDHTQQISNIQLRQSWTEQKNGGQDVWLEDHEKRLVHLEK